MKPEFKLQYQKKYKLWSLSKEVEATNDKNKTLALNIYNNNVGINDKYNWHLKLSNVYF
jgi:hypothetical protein